MSAISDGLRRFPLTELPTPVRRMSALEREVGAGSLWVKCDDISGRPYGGNKPRKLEYLIAQALQRGRAGVATTGGTGTHHGLATAIAAREAGLTATLVLLPQPVNEHVRESMLLMHAYGARMYLAESIPAVASRIVSLLARAALAGSPLSLIPTGGTNALGTVGFVRAALELAEQVRNGELPQPDAIFTALGSGGTAAGLVAGLRLAGLQTAVVPVLVTNMLAPTERRLASLAAAALRRMRRSGDQIPPLELPAVSIERGYLGGGYGVATEAGEVASRIAFDREGIELEPTYTAKTFAAFLDAARSRRYGNNLLFWNTFSSTDPKAGLDRLPEPGELPAPFQRFWNAPR